MYWPFDRFIDFFDQNKKLAPNLLKGKWGLEKEFLRVDAEGHLALTPHPEVWGDKLTNPLITTDYSESQTELVTPPYESIEEVFAYLENLQKKVVEDLGQEFIWPMSMPSHLPEEADIPIAHYGESKEAKIKEQYREHLARRYGKKMQMVCGIHYNFSFADDLFETLARAQNFSGDLEAFKNERYFSLGRNFLRYKWLFIYLFGASPVVDKSYEPRFIEKMERLGPWWKPCTKRASYYLEHATSLRMSRLGYSNTLRGEVEVSYNSLHEYIRDIREAITEKGLFSEAEYYSLIRFKQNTQNDETLLQALEKRGINHVEIRGLDINPFLPLGVSLSRLYFCHVFMLFCLFESSDPLTQQQKKDTLENQETVALCGRKEDLDLLDEKGQSVRLRTWTKEIFEKLEKIAALLDQAQGGDTYAHVIARQKRKIEDVSLLPSAKILSEMETEDESFLDFGVRMMKSQI